MFKICTSEELRDDPIVEEVRLVRERLDAQFDFDIGSIFQDMRERQTELCDRLVRRQQPLRIELESASDQEFIALHPGR